MESKVELKRFSSSGTLRARVLWIVVAMAVSCLAGCEHRMSLSDFISRYGDAVHAVPDEPDEGIDVSAKVQQSLGPYQVGAGDVLVVTVTMGSPDALKAVPVQVRVMANGMVDLPLAGSVAVGGGTLEDAEVAIRKAYVPDYYAQASVHVQVIEAATVNVLVVGATPAPGLVSLARNERNLLFAVARAAGVSPSAATAPVWASGIVTLRRVSAPGEDVTVDLTTPGGIRTALSLDPLADGDIVMVDSSGSNTIFVGGLVNAVGPQTYADGTEVTILQALAAAGGTRADLFPHEGTLIRRISGKDVHVKLDPHTVDTRIHEFLQNTVYLRVGASAVYGAQYRDVGSKRHGDEKDTDGTTVFFP
jgi:protein involved in polysaccharide export with SLBB domain